MGNLCKAEQGNKCNVHFKVQLVKRRTEVNYQSVQLYLHTDDT